jgi:phytoene dehydrogenase-like protein
VAGVELAGGEVLRARTVVATTDPRRTVVEWLGRSAPTAAAGMVRRWEARPVRYGYESKMDAVLATRPRYLAYDDTTLAALGVDDPLVPTTVVAPTIAEMAEAHRLSGTGAVARRPIFVVNLPSVRDPSMRPPGGGEILSLEVLWTPYSFNGGWADDAEARRWLAAYGELLVPGFAESVLRWRAMTPPDYETGFGLPAGYAPSFAGGPLAALVGKGRELTRYETPVRGLFLSGAGTFPGAGVWGAAGRNAAHAVLARHPTSRRA